MPEAEGSDAYHLRHVLLPRHRNVELRNFPSLWGVVAHMDSSSAGGVISIEHHAVAVEELHAKRGQIARFRFYPDVQIMVGNVVTILVFEPSVG